jgi:formylglycine-generating enzyme
VRGAGWACIALAACAGARPEARTTGTARAPAPSIATADHSSAPGSSPSAGAAGVSAEGRVAVPARCPPDMIALPSVCIDPYEAPNVRGAFPLAQTTAYEGERWCAARGKRLCYEDEWQRACEGPHGRRFPYGDIHRVGACNDDRPWIVVRWSALATWPSDEAVAEGKRLFQADTSGARAACVSEEGVYDLTGNVAEWVRRRGEAPRPGWEHVLKGCYWAGCYHQPQPDCAFTNHAHPGSFRTYEAGFRCCADPRGPA